MPSSDQKTCTLPLFVGVDVGGTNIKIGILDERGITVAESKFPTQPGKPSRVAFEQAKDELDQLLDKCHQGWGDVAAVGLGTPGPLDAKAGIILTPSNLPGWHNSPVRKELEEILDKPVTFANDANAAGYGEYWVGSGKQYDSLVMLTLGTGVGGGIIINNLSLNGSTSHAAELGHITVDTTATARSCGCGQKGHLEAYASATALVDRTLEAMSGQSTSRVHSILIEQTNEDSPLTALKISNAAAEGDELAVHMIEETATWLGRGIAILSHVIDPDVFILGGAMNFGGTETKHGRKFLNDITETARELMFPVPAQKLVVDFARLGSDAGYSGAAGLARNDFLSNSDSRS